MSIRTRNVPAAPSGGHPATAGRPLTAASSAGTRRCLVAVVLALLLVPPSTTPLAAQAERRALGVEVAEESVYTAPGGAEIGVLFRGTVVEGGAARDRWREITVRLWMPAASVSRTPRDGYQLVVARGGATLHAAPDGALAGRAFGGLLLHEETRQGGWVRVRRTGWIRAAALAASEAAPPVGTGRLLHASPRGNTIGALDPEAPLEVLGREGEWARVRTEGWVLVPPGTELRPAGTASSPSLKAVRDEPERFRGSTLRWSVQFVALQRADSLRTDFQAGEWYVLARDPGGEPGFVYLAVPPPMLPAVRRLTPLQRVTVVGRVRTGRSPLMGHPVLELQELLAGGG